MNLEKSKRSALVLSAVTVLTFSVIDAILNLLIPYIQSRDIHTIVADPESMNNPGSVLGVIIFFLILLTALTAIGAFWLYRFFGENYFGERSLQRCALFGFLFALFLELPEWFIPSSWGIIRVLLQFLGLFAAFFLARRLIPLSFQPSEKL